MGQTFLSKRVLRSSERASRAESDRAKARGATNKRKTRSGTLWKCPKHKRTRAASPARPVSDQSPPARKRQRRRTSRPLSRDMGDRGDPARSHARTRVTRARASELDRTAARALSGNSVESGGKADPTYGPGWSKVVERLVSIDDMCCRICMSAKEGDKNNRIIFCDRCFSGYHIRCHPNLGRMPRGRWRCALCDLDSRPQTQRKRPVPVGPRRRSARRPLASLAADWAEAPIRGWRSAAAVPAKVRELYKAIKRATGELGGDGPGGAIYGEMTCTSFQRVVDALEAHAGLCADSKFLDIGAGLGKPNLHVAVSPGVRMSVGIELMPVRWQLSLLNLRAALKSSPLARRKMPNVAFARRDATEVACLDPFTHVYMYDVAFTPPVLEAIARAYNTSSTPQYLISYHKPRKIIWEHRFLVHLVAVVPNTSMMGSGGKRTAYIYRRFARAEPSVEDGEGSPDRAILEAEKLLQRSTPERYGEWIQKQIDACTHAQPPTRSRRSARQRR